MDFDHAISAHSSWKAKLRTYLAKPDGSLSPSEVAQDNKCELGKWISGEAAKYSSLPEFQTVRSEHARFHKAAADVIQRADLGQNVSEETSLGAKSEFSSATTAVVSALMALKRKVASKVLVTQ